jgi:hypothetical protein
MDSALETTVTPVACKRGSSQDMALAISTHTRTDTALAAVPF